METRAIKERFDASEYFTIAEEIRDVSRINDVFKYGEIGLVMVFSDDFENELHLGGDAAVQLITDGTEPNQASMITGYAYAYLCHDDLNSHCARKGERHNGDSPCLTHETDIYHSF